LPEDGHTGGSVSNGPSEGQNADEDGPVVRKKAHDFLGMFEYKQMQEQQILKALIYGKNHRDNTVDTIILSFLQI